MVAILGWIVAMLQGLAAATALVLWRAVDGLRRRGARRLGPLPPLIVVRPIRGLDPGLAANVRAALAQRYPGALETIFVLDDTGDPAYPVVRRLVHASSARARVVIAGPIHPGRTGKLHAMIEGLRSCAVARSMRPAGSAPPRDSSSTTWTSEPAWPTPDSPTS